jgi:hypothetical protein
MPRDHIVDEVRRVRENEAAKHGFDVKAILAAAKRRQRRSGRKVVSFVPKKQLSACGVTTKRARHTVQSAGQA